MRRLEWKKNTVRATIVFFMNLMQLQEIRFPSISTLMRKVKNGRGAATDSGVVDSSVVTPGGCRIISLDEELDLGLQRHVAVVRSCSDDGM